MTNEDLISCDVQEQIVKLLEELKIKNYTLDISAGSIRGDNYLGIIAKVIISGKDKNDKDTTLHLIVKSAPRNDVFRSLTPIRDAYAREIYVYTKIFPEFTKLQDERGISKQFKSFAKCYKCTMNNLNEALIMGDMKELGFELRNRHEPLNYNHVLMVVKEYGKLHALSYAMRDQKPELFQEISDNTHDVFFEQFTDNEKLKSAAKEQSDRALNALDPVQDKVACERFRKFQERQLDTVSAAVKSEPAGRYGVIGHGDSWVNNLLFKYEDSSKPQSPVEVCLLDWQLSRLGSPALDLAYFIFTCTDKELRDQHYEELIKEYYNSLCSFLRELGSDPEKLLPFHVLQEHLKKFCVYGLYMAVMVLYLMTSDVEEIPDIHNLKDEDDAIEKFTFQTKNIEKYNCRVRGIILDFIKYDYDF